MNKFEQNELKAKALTYVARSVQSSIDYAIQDIEAYKKHAEDNEETDPDESYWLGQARERQAVLDLWNELAAYLEKKLK